MRDRLIDLLLNVDYALDTDGRKAKDSAEFIADYLLANGVVCPPCKVGDYLWFITNNRLVFGKVENVLQNHSGLFAYVFELDNDDIVDEWSIPLCDFGKTVFLTKEDAERGGVMAYIKLDEKKIKRLIREAQMFQDDIVCAIGTDFMRNIAEAENKMIFDVLKGLLSEPAPDVAEVKHGEWKIKRDEYDCEYMKCSVCKEEFYPTDADTVDTTPNYCMNCGARMEVEK